MIFCFTLFFDIVKWIILSKVKSQSKKCCTLHLFSLKRSHILCFILLLKNFLLFYPETYEVSNHLLGEVSFLKSLVSCRVFWRHIDATPDIVPLFISNPTLLSYVYLSQLLRPETEEMSLRFPFTIDTITTGALMS